jgi:RimJ/RimL family protein N-acetyltransferase
MWDDVLSQYLIEQLSTGEAIGHVVAHQPRLIHGTAHVAIIVRPDLYGKGWPLEGAGLFVDYLFRVFPLRKLYAETVEYNYDSSFAHGAGRFFSEEARLKAHHYYDGRYWDAVVLSLYRDDWNALASPFFDRLTRRSAAAAPDRKLNGG